MNGRARWRRDIYRDMVRSRGARPRAEARAATRSSSASCCRSASRVTGPKRNLKPLRFLRSFFSRGKRSPGLDGFAYHPYTRPRRADARRALAGRRRRSAPTGASGACSTPPAPAGAHRRQEAADLEHRVRLPDEPARTRSWPRSRACRSSGRSPSSGSRTPNRRIKSISQYTMNDQPGDPSLWQSGLRFADGRPKTNIYDNFRLPILVRPARPRARSRCAAPRARAGPASVQVYQRGRRGALQEPRRRDDRAQRARLLRRSLPDLATPPTEPSASGHRRSTSLAVKPVIFR